MAARPAPLLVVGVLILGAVAWDAVARSRRAAEPVASPPRPDTVVVTAPARRPIVAPASPRAVPESTGGAAAAGGGGATYTEQLARADTRRRVRAGARQTYLNEMIAAADDSMLRRWHERAYPPVRVHLTRGTVPHFQSGFRDAVRAAFSRWGELALPVRFDLDADSAAADVLVVWRERFDMNRTGQTDLRWDAQGHLLTGVISIATVDPNGRAMSADDVRVVTLHEVGHLLGLDHSPDSNDIMFPIARVRSLSTRDIETARLLYQLPPGSLR
jgi:hypothetical protein